jgi:hypothetical protein
VPTDAQGRLMPCRIFIRICIAYELWLSMVTVGGGRSGTSPMPDFDGDTVPTGMTSGCELGWSAAVNFYKTYCIHLGQSGTVFYTLIQRMSWLA